MYSAIDRHRNVAYHMVALVAVSLRLAHIVFYFYDLILSVIRDPSGDPVDLLDVVADYPHPGQVMQIGQHALRVLLKSFSL